MAILQSLEQLANKLRRLGRVRGTWILFYADSVGLKFPNFIPVMIHKNPNKLRKLAARLPKTKTGSYQLFFLPNNFLLPAVGTSGIDSMLGLYHHEHLTEEDDEDDDLTEYEED